MTPPQLHLSIRAYHLHIQRHSHAHHQLVLPLSGQINIEMNTFVGTVSVGQCIVIHEHIEHGFTADERARFLVVDLSSLPPLLQPRDIHRFRISQDFLNYIIFLENQLIEVANQAVEDSLKTLFWAQLAKQQPHLINDNRIDDTLTIINQDLSVNYSINQLAKHACLGVTQYKTRFKQAVGTTVGQYIIQQRMKRAQSLLRYTDMPVTQVALEIGYRDVSAFSRRYKSYFGINPSNS